MPKENKTKNIVKSKNINNQKKGSVKLKTKIKKDDLMYKKIFLSNALLFVAIVTVFNFVVYVFDGNIFNKQENINIINNDYVSDENNNVYFNNGVTFYYPKSSIVKENNDMLSVDNWNIAFYKKSNSFVGFESWFKGNFEEKNCIVKTMESDDVDLAYYLYYVDGIDCKNNGLYMVGNQKIGRILLGVNPNESYEQVLASIKF